MNYAIDLEEWVQTGEPLLAVVDENAEIVTGNRALLDILGEDRTLSSVFAPDWYQQIEAGLRNALAAHRQVTMDSLDMTCLLYTSPSPRD